MLRVVHTSNLHSNSTPASQNHYHFCLSNWKTILEAPVEEPAKEEVVVEQKEKEIESESKLIWKIHAGFL